MKKAMFLGLTFVLTASILAACRKMPDEMTEIPTMDSSETTGSTQATGSTGAGDGNTTMPESGMNRRNTVGKY